MNKSEFIVKNEELADLLISNTPDSIFLNTGDLYVGIETKYDFDNLDDITWYSESNGLCDIEYIRKDLIDSKVCSSCIFNTTEFEQYCKRDIARPHQDYAYRLDETFGCNKWQDTEK